jgi:DNA-binding SARP family transcriptional activator
MAVGVSIRLLGRPAVERDGRTVAGPRGHKAWGLLAYLALAETPPSRQRLVSLLFDEADDPRRALRWNLAELRRALAGIVTAEGDPVVLDVVPGHAFDVDVLTGAPADGVSPAEAATLGGELLEGMPFADSPAFEAWLAVERQRLAADGRTLVYESALRLLAAGEPVAAARVAARAVELDPYDGDHPPVLVRALAQSGDLDGARQQVARCSDLFRRELGVDPPPDVERAAQPSPSSLAVASAAGPAEPGAGHAPLATAGPEAGAGAGRSAGSRVVVGDEAAAMDEPDEVGHALVVPLVPLAPEVVSAAAVRSYLDAGRASVAAGAVPTGIDQLGRAVAVAERVGDEQLLGAARLELAGALIHGRGGRGAEVAGLLHQALVAAERAGDPGTAAAACRELGFLGVQLGHRQSAEHWLARAEAHCAGVDEHERGKVLGVRGQNLSDAAAYPAALAVLGASLELAQRTGAPRQEAWVLAMIGRLHVLRDEPALAIAVLDRALELVRGQRWTAFLPWPETFRAEAALAIGDSATAGDLLDHAWILASETQDHCWLVAAAHGLARLAAAEGDHERALRWCETGLRPRAWYLWPRARLLDAGCEMAVPHAPDLARRWATELAEIAARGAMHELTARARFHRSRLGDDHVLDVARTVAEDIDNPSLHRLLDAGGRGAVA